MHLILSIIYSTMDFHINKFYYIFDFIMKHDIMHSSAFSTSNKIDLSGCKALLRLLTEELNYSGRQVKVCLITIGCGKMYSLMAFVNKSTV